ncbi:MAG: isocitrate lyase/phosphoenolpyruvate mutase family protein, partial [Bacteriovoracaceae bacterium]|nr:isocitrate lyase/phosphoenolpyruvate mutase family protein [Bacteriovoracaceae bacterium]
RLVQKLESRDVAAVCIEDKIFPKTNSFIRGEAQPLADIEEFAGKIKAGCDTRKDHDFSIIARVEALIAGWGLEEALKRAEAYRLAGADAILMHSKISKPDEIFAFMNAWGLDRAKKCPIVIVPTKYYATPTEQFRQHNISLVIWANHLMRTSLTAMQKTAKTIFEEQSLMNVEDKVAPLTEVFRLQNDSELAEAESLYLTAPNAQSTRAIILAASRGVDLGDLTIDRPKALLKLGNTSPAERLVSQLNNKAIKDITIVRGYQKEAFKIPNINYVDNSDFATTGELYSLSLALPKIQETTVITYGDILFRSFVLNELLEDKADITIVVDANLNRPANYKGDFVKTTAPYSNSFLQSAKNTTLLETQFTELSPNTYQGEWIGLLKVNDKGARVIAETLKTMMKADNFMTKKIPDLLNELAKKGQTVNVLYIDGHWMDIDHLSDLDKGQIFIN